jgi:hypothetical protein
MRSVESWEWKRTVSRGGCVMCRATAGCIEPARELAHPSDLRRIEAHHIITQQQLKREGFEAWLWDARNGMALCGWHHPRHHNYRQRVPRELLPAGVFAFAAELVSDRHPHGLGWILDTEYLERLDVA